MEITAFYSLGIPFRVVECWKAVGCREGPFTPQSIDKEGISRDYPRISLTDVLLTVC